MLKILSLLLFLALVNCQGRRNPALDLLVPNILNQHNLKVTKGDFVDNNRHSLSPIDKEDSGEEDCYMEDGASGLCVNFYRCSKNKTIIYDGSSNNDDIPILDIRSTDGPCESYMDVCCLPIEGRQPTIKKIEPGPVKEGCGWRNPNGADMKTTGETSGETKFGEFPWMVAVLKVQPFYESIGGGSLIALDVVLTAAHIARSGPQRIRAGEWDTETTNEIYPFQDRDVTSMEIHEKFTKRNLNYDVALLFLSEPVTLAPHVGVVCLPPPNTITPANTGCFATGWGKHKFGKEGRYQIILKKVEVPVVERSACQTALRSTRLGRFFRLHTSFMCAGGEKDKDACKGDGGSPLSCPILHQEGRYVQSGIVAWGIGCGTEGIPGVYVDVSSVREWIDEKMVNMGVDIRTYSNF